MRFLIKQTGSGGERIGNLSGFMKSPSVTIETPTAALFTQGGSIVHLTADVLSWVFPNPRPLWMPLTNCIQLENGVKAQNEGITKFAGLQNHISCVSLNNLSEVAPSGHFESDKVPLWTKNGKKMLTAQRYMDVMEVFKPDIILAIADGRTSLNEGSKRLSKAVDRTTNMLKICVEKFKTNQELQNSSLVGVIVGVGNPKKCDDCIENILKHVDSLSGVALEGVTDGSEESMDVNIEKFNEVFYKVANAIPKDLLRIVEGCWSPAVILSAIEHGWDFFDGSYPVKLTNSGIALKLNFDVTKDGDAYLLDMIDEKYKEDFSPILEGCECLTCKKHTRAYIRHLLNTREMLASVLLSIYFSPFFYKIVSCTDDDSRTTERILIILSRNLHPFQVAQAMVVLLHNLHHFDQMFYHARQHIASNTFTTYRQHITKQCEALTNFPPDRYKGLNKKEEKSSGQKKKIRVSDNVEGNRNSNVV